MNTKKNTSDRYNFIDVLRGAAIISMIVYHLCYDIFVVFKVDPKFFLYPAVIIWELTISVSFVVISGISLNFSRRAYKRGVIVNLCGFLITLITVLCMPSQQIWFGVLNLIGCAMIITHALRGLLDRIPSSAGMTVSFGAYLLTYGIPYGFLGIGSLRLIELPQALYTCKYLAFLGFPSKDFFSADFFPLLPWLFLFVFGYFLWRFIKERGRDSLLRFDLPALSFIGRHSLIIYMVHQPLLYLLCAAIFGHF